MFQFLGLSEDRVFEKSKRPKFTSEKLPSNYIADWSQQYGKIFKKGHSLE